MVKIHAHILGYVHEVCDLCICRRSWRMAVALRHNCLFILQTACSTLRWQTSYRSKKSILGPMDQVVSLVLAEAAVVTKQEETRDRMTLARLQ